MGLLFGRRNAEVTRVVVALDLTQAAVDKGEGAGRADDRDASPDHVRRCQARDGRDARRPADARYGLAGISHAAAHTNLDAAQGGVNDTLMRVMGAENVRGEGFVRVGDVPEGTTFRPALRAGAEEAARRRPRVRQRGNAGACAGLLLRRGRRKSARHWRWARIVHLPPRALDALDRGCCIIEAGHFETENPICEVLADALQKAADALQYNVTVFSA